MRILIIDDSKATLEIVRRSLERFGYRRLEIEKAASAKEAIAIIGQRAPDIVLTDWHMPDMSGLTLIRELVKRDLGIKFAMITTVEEQQQIDQAIAAGASFVLTKPFRDDELHEKLLPLIQGAEESEVLLNEMVEVDSELALPKLSQFEKLLQRAVSPKVEVKNIRRQAFDDSKLPCLMAIYEDVDSQRVRAIAVLDIYAACVLAKSNKKLADSCFYAAIHSRLVTKDFLDSCEKVLANAALAFLDRKTRKSLRLKSVSFIPKSFAKFEAIYEKPDHQRLDFACQLPNMAPGKITLVGY